MTRRLCSLAVAIGFVIAAAGLAEAQIVDRQGRCAASLPLADPSKGPRWNAWGAGVTNTRFQPADQAGLSAEQVPNLKLKWAFGFASSGSAYAQPTVAGSRIFVGSQSGTVYSIDAKTGCIYWTFTAQNSVRTALTIGS